MADLMEHLIQPSSQESYSSSQAAPATAAPPTTEHQPHQDQHDSSTIAALQAAGLDVQNVESYLSNPETSRLLKAASAPTAWPTFAEGSVAPVQLGPARSSQCISELTQIAQQRGLQAHFDFDEPQRQRFTGALRLGTHVVRLPDGVTFGSKREAKEALAAEGLEVLRRLPAAAAPGGGQAGLEGGEENWVGKLVGA